ncbi:MAG: hypothetical protein QOJ50_2211, partial [Cryptosporangiaceae bacterium]|nr:hypothetical protein [Cryptosporangiaceae bacterium]
MALTALGTAVALAGSQHRRIVL